MHRFGATSIDLVSELTPFVRAGSSRGSFRFPWRTRRFALVANIRGDVRFVYNVGLEQRSWWTQSRRHFRQKISVASQMRDLTEARAEFDWLRAGSTVVQQVALRDLDRAFTNFFAHRSGYPKFKKRSGARQGFVVRDLVVRRINRRWREIVVPKAGWVRFRIPRAWTDICAATSARIALTNGRWTVSLTTPPPRRQACTTALVVGIDRGVANSIATSKGRMFHAPGFRAGNRVGS